MKDSTRAELENALISLSVVSMAVGMTAGNCDWRFDKASDTLEAPIDKCLSKIEAIIEAMAAAETAEVSE